uniref:Cytidyltransferase-like domain-containing protein n=1 Tax=Panagrolaimus superbus TaxID=310955 RepID=A0A914YYM3_9BILA
MVEVGLLVLSRRAIPFIAEKLASAAQQVRTRLYVRIDPQRSPNELRQLIPTIYLYASQKCSHLDVRVLLKEKQGADYGTFLHELNEKDDGIPNDEPTPFKHVCLGGTFDRLHNGHKVLLSTAALLSDKITCGVTGGEMNRKKTLYELIEPLDRRIDVVEEFLKDITDGVTVDVQEIQDPFGPAIVIKDLDCIIVSQETVKGGQAVNQKRKERGLSELDIQKIELVEGSDEILKEVKLSSSSQRYQLLGSLLKPPNEFLSTTTSTVPYVIGLTGGIAAGKSSISKFLAENGCEIADCDKIVHELYDGNPKFTKAISEEFGVDTISNGTVDRKKLGSIVFQNREKREKLNKIVWPAVSDVIQERIKKTTSDVFVIDAALLVEAGWQSTVRQLWTVFIPRAEAVKRIVERDGISEKDADLRIDSQLSNEARIAASHVVFCSLWEEKETQRQVLKALNHLRQNYIKK